MRLTGDKLEQFISALLDAFPTQTSLERMVRVELDKNLSTLALGDDLGEVAYKLIKVAETEGWINKLVVAAYRSNPGNEQLSEFYKQFKKTLEKEESVYELTIRKEHRIVTHSYQLPNPCNFDLTHLIEDSLEKVEGKKGLIGLAIPCDFGAFLESYCERLKRELGRNNVQIRRPLTLKPTNISVDEAIAIIKRCKQMLQINDILYPLVIQFSDKNMASNFWQKMCLEFTGNFESRLIVIMGGDSGTAFPENVTLLEAPQFKEAHIITWVRDVVAYLEWPYYVREKWRQRMVADCSHNNALHVGFVYEHLEYTVQLLQGNLSYESFLEELEKRSLYCV